MTDLTCQFQLYTKTLQRKTISGCRWWFREWSEYTPASTTPATKPLQLVKGERHLKIDISVTFTTPPSKTVL